MDDLEYYFDEYNSSRLIGDTSKDFETIQKESRYREYLDYRDIEKIKVVGKGVFGKVYKCKYQDQIYALKTLTNSSKLSAQERERHLHSLKLEARALSQVRVCDFVVQMAGTCLDKSNQVCILMEYVHGPNLHQFMENFHHLLPWSKKESLGWEIANGVKFIHDKNILHRDLKSDNILISLVPSSHTDRLSTDISDLMNLEPNMQHVHAKIADFGICKITNENTYSTSESFRGAGSPPWMAPELCTDETLLPTKLTDVYSLGWVLWELAVADGRRPYEGYTLHQIYKFKLSGYIEPLPEETPEYYSELVTACTSYQASNRPYAEQVVDTIKDAQEVEAEGEEMAGGYQPFNQMYETRAFHSTKAPTAAGTEVFLSNQFPSNPPAPRVKGVSLASEASLREFTTEECKQALLENLAERCLSGDFEAKTDILVLFGINFESESSLLCGVGDCFSSDSQGFSNITKAIDYFERAASQGHPTAICKLGLCYRDGIGKQQNTSKAIHCFEMAAEKHDPIAQCCLGECYTLGIGVELDLTLALKYFELAAARNNADAQMQLGKCHYNGLGTKIDPEKAYHYFQLAATQDHPEAQYILGVMLAQGISRPPNRIDSFRWFSKAAGLGHAEAQNNVGSCYYFGRGVTRDMDQAIEWFFKAADQNSASAQNNLGHCYEMGHGVQTNAQEAFKWFELAAKNQHPGAQNSLANFYMSGKAVAKSSSQALAWYTSSAENNHPRGMKNLALCYYEGVGTPKDDQKAYYWYNQAAELNNVESCMKLGRLAAHGEGVPLDHSLAFYWYNRAAEAGDIAGQVAVGKCFLRGKGVPRNLDEGFYWISKAASQNHATALTYLGVCHLSGHGTPKNPSKAFQCFSKGSNLGSSQAHFHLGDLYRKGVGVPNGAEIDKALEYYERAANRKHPMAQFYLGVCYHRGLGVNVDLKKAYKLIKDAAASGCQPAVPYLEKVETQIKTQGQITKGSKSDRVMGKIDPANGRMPPGRPASPPNFMNKNKNYYGLKQPSDKECLIL